MHEIDQDILNRCRSGDAAAWARLARQYGGLVYAIARRSGLDEHACDDVAQSVFASLVRALPEVREASALPGWLSTTARREAWRVSRARSRARHAAALEDLEETPAAVAEIVEHQRLRRAMEELGGRCRDLLHAIYFRPVKPSYQELSESLGIPVGGIGPTRQRCLAKLASLLGVERSNDPRDLSGLNVF